MEAEQEGSYGNQLAQQEQRLEIRINLFLPSGSMSVCPTQEG